MSALEKRRVRQGVGDAVIVVDIQNDFLPGGSLAVPRGDEIIPVFNLYLAAAEARDLPVFATRDWHPSRHCSFKSQGGLWPSHCVAGSEGAGFAPGLRLPPSALIISKGTDMDKDAYSGFEGTDLDERRRSIHITRLFIGGLATDYCVLSTVRDALSRGYQVFLLQDAVRAVNVEPEDGRKAVEEMTRLGAVSITREMIE